MVKTFVFLFAFSLPGFTYSGHQQPIDSIWQTIEVRLKNKERNKAYARLIKTEKNSDKINIILDLFDELEYKHPEEAVFYVRQAQHIAHWIENHYGIVWSRVRIAQLLNRQNKNDEAIEELSIFIGNTDEAYEEYLPEVYNTLGFIYYSSTRYDKSLDVFEKGLKLARKYQKHDDANKIISNTAVIYDELGNYTKAIDNYFSALRYAEKHHHISNVIDLYINISTCYFEMDSVQLAIEYGHKSLDVLQHMVGEQYQLAEAICTGNLADYYLFEKDFRQARNYISRSLRIAMEIADEVGIANAYRVIGEIKTSTKAYDLALQNYQKSLNISESIQDKQGQIIANREISHTLSKLDNIPYALTYARRSLDMAERTGSAKDIKEGYLLMADLYEKEQTFDSSLHYYKKFITLRDSLHGREKAQEILNIRTNYDLERKEKEIENLSQQASIHTLELKQSKLKLTILAITVVVLILIVLAVYLILKQKQIVLKQQAQDTQQNLLRTQMNPHFIFNAMSAIQDYMRQGDGSQASLYLIKFSRLMRQVLDSSRSEYITLYEEVSMLDNYLSLQCMRHQCKFRHEIIVSDEIDPTAVSLPPMFAQPFVENAIEHGLTSTDEDAFIQIRFSIEGDHLLLEVTDNGVGIRETVRARTDQHISHATRITQERINLYRQRSNRKIAFSINELTEGTRVVLNLPYQYT